MQWQRYFSKQSDMAQSYKMALYGYKQIPTRRRRGLADVVSDHRSYICDVMSIFCEKKEKLT